jgi:flavin reductase (DIM6/NTAB) family NADH-FMN oxidoreductase RutF
MKAYNRNEIADMEKVFRLNVINSISGYKAANLIGTKGEQGSNLAIFSSVIHLGSNPPLLGMICRPATVPRHTLCNIEESGSYTINHISEKMHKRAHYTSAKFQESESEFEHCKFEEEYLAACHAPFVKESPIKMEMEWKENISIKLNGTILVIGEIKNIYLNDGIIQENGQLDLNQAEVVCISGLNRYHKVEEIGHYPYARRDELPDFSDNP